MENVKRFAYALQNAFGATNEVMKCVAADLGVKPEALYNVTRTRPGRKPNPLMARLLTGYMVEKLDASIQAQMEAVNNTQRIRRELLDAYREVYKK